MSQRIKVRKITRTDSATSNREHKQLNFSRSIDRANKLNETRNGKRDWLRRQHYHVHGNAVVVY